ncbi:complex I assembly factor TMEM126B mitochondrial [Biomphalaria pfeifferi]|uniref:Complex I assembly factor TMEM126B mitochondrial n=1 Tax=Biomphalaria pfeifferi TaxID=112525 RepID=A0AAD8C584_BIOPF|nr:complex I assembly factor TMEM126B mitochondrial [Biomphalaria pfeifferi]
MEKEVKDLGGPVLVKRGDVIPSGAVPMSDNEVLEFQLNRVKHFQPQSQMVPYNYCNYIIGTAVALSSLVIISTMRRNFQLGGLSKGLTYGPSVLLPSAMAGAWHEFGIKNKILLGREPCSVCVTLRSAAYTALLGVGYPLIVSFLACIPVARKNYTLPLASSAEGFGYVKLVKHVIPKSSVLLQLILGNFIVGSWFAHRELKLFHRHFST